MGGHFNLGLASLGGKYAAKKRKKFGPLSMPRRVGKPKRLSKSSFLNRWGNRGPELEGGKAWSRTCSKLMANWGNGPSPGCLTPTCCPLPPSGTKGRGVRQKGGDKFPLTRLQDPESPWPRMASPEQAWDFPGALLFLLQEAVVAAEVEGEGLRQAPSPLPQHLPHLSQFCDKSVARIVGSDGPVVTGFLEPVVPQGKRFLQPCLLLPF